jgi:hypothetical protein
VRKRRLLVAKYKTVAFDSVGELARLYFSKDMGKHADKNGMETIRGMQNYPGTTERLNMLVRRCKNLRDQGTEVVFLAHEQIERIYAKGGMMAKKGEQPMEPIAIKGLPEMPGKQTPEEFARAADNVVRMRKLNDGVTWVGRREPIGGGGDYWEVKTRFNSSLISGGLMPGDYNKLLAAAKQFNIQLDLPYLWIIYGTFGIGKTRSLLSFPRPLKLFDLDRGSTVIKHEVEALRTAGETFDIVDNIDCEESNHYEKFVSELEATFG